MKKLIAILTLIIFSVANQGVFAVETLPEDLEATANYITALNKLSLQNPSITMDTDISEKLDICQVFIVMVNDNTTLKSSDEHILRIQQITQNTFSVFGKNAGAAQLIASYGSTKKAYNISINDKVVNLESARLVNGLPLTKENVRKTILSLKDDYPEGMKWAMEKSYLSPPMFSEGFGCAAFCLEISDKLFGYLPSNTTSHSYGDIKIGDFVSYETERGENHMVIPIEKTEEGLYVVEGNYNGRIKWERYIPRDALEGHNLLVESRYPD